MAPSSQLPAPNHLNNLSTVEGGGLELLEDFHPRDHSFRLLSYQVLPAKVQSQRPDNISGWRATRQWTVLKRTFLEGLEGLELLLEKPDIQHNSLSEPGREDTGATVETFPPFRPSYAKIP